MYPRLLNLSPARKSFFLWGQRQTGKSSLLQNTFGDRALTLNLLESDTFLKYSTEPHRLREELQSKKQKDIVIIDEVQKVPALLNEVHSLIESHKIIFGLCGSSARKLRRGHANLLGGRAHRFELYGLCAKELGSHFDLTQLLNRGYLPSHYDDQDAYRSIQSYVGDYLKEEILAEGLTRNLPIFSRFLEVAAHSDTEPLNFSNIAREVGVSTKTAQAHFEILVDTLTGSFLMAYTKNQKRRIKQTPKFYFHDVGVVNFLAKRKNLEPKSSLFGKAFENWVFHELNCYRSYHAPDLDLTYWALTTGAEVDFVLNSMEIAIEAKSTDRITSDHLKNLRVLKDDHAKVKHRVLISLEKKTRITEDGIIIVPYRDFAERLWSGDWT
jgi:predicted AAA+ superfamily ATPase